MDFSGLPESPHRKVFTLTANSPTAGVQWGSLAVPKQYAMCNIFLLSNGGAGGNGAIGANSTAAGGGGGGSSSQSILNIPTALLPNVIYYSIAIGGTGAGFASYISAQAQTQAHHVLLIANGGGTGGNAAGATAGAAGAAGGAGTIATAILGGAHATFIAGQAGIIGGVAVAGANLTVPTTGLRVTGGTGGGGLPAAAATGTSGGNLTIPAISAYFPVHNGGVGSATATNPAAPGAHGYLIKPQGMYFYGGMGGASTHGTATGAGLAQGAGGQGGNGSGGGGSGGALTGSAAAPKALGGDGLAIVTFY